MTSLLQRPMDNLIRLNKYIASHSQYSRREVDALITAGSIRLNDEVIRTLGHKIDPDSNPTITIHRQPLKITNRPATYVVLNKPNGYVVTRAEFPNERSIMQILPTSLQHVKPVGRLDKHSTGLLILTDDGALMQELTHPSYQHEKEYIVRVKYPLKAADLRAFAGGMILEEGPTGEAKVEPIDEYRFKITIHQGWNRQIRRMVEARDNRVQSLQRIRVGKLTLGTLPLGQWKVIQRDEIC